VARRVPVRRTKGIVRKDHPQAMEKPLGCAERWSARAPRRAERSGSTEPNTQASCSGLQRRVVARDFLNRELAIE
jgi:hypothetical protein